MSRSRFVVLDRLSSELLYEADSLPQVKGFVDGCEDRPTVVAALLDSHRMHYRYQVCIIDDRSGEIVTRGPVVDLLAGCELLYTYSICLVPERDDADCIHAR